MFSLSQVTDQLIANTKYSYITIRLNTLTSRLVKQRRFAMDQELSFSFNFLLTMQSHLRAIYLLVREL